MKIDPQQELPASIRNLAELHSMGGVSLRSVDPENCTPVKLIAFRHNPTDGGELWLFTALHLHASTQQHPPLEAQLQATLNVIPIQVWYATPSGVLIFVNEAAA